MYGAVGEKSIDFLKILYRLFSDTSVHPLGQYWSNDLLVWELPSAPIVQTLGRRGSNDLFVWENRSTLSVEKGTKVPRREATFTNEWFRCVGEGTWFCV